jgi:uncharacterized protein (TIGR02271 family)
MNNEGQRTSREVIEQKLGESATVMDATGETIGVVTGYDLQGGYMDVGGGMLFAKETRIPLDAIGDTGASGLYLRGTSDELTRQYGGGAGAMNEAASAPMATTRRAQPVAQASVAIGSSDQAADQVAATDRTVRQADDDIRVPVYEEELVVGKQQEQIVDVHLRKEVVTEQESVPVTLRHEEVTVERVPVTGQASQADLQTAFQGQDIDVPVMGEEAVAGKQVREVEEVRLHKQATEEQRQVSDTVRRERVVVDGVDQQQGTTGARDAGLNDRTR